MVTKQKLFLEFRNSLGISKTQVSNILSEKFVPIKSNIVELAEFFEVSPLEFIKEKDLGEKNDK